MFDSNYAPTGSAFCGERGVRGAQNALASREVLQLFGQQVQRRMQRCPRHPASIENVAGPGNEAREQFIVVDVEGRRQIATAAYSSRSATAPQSRSRASRQSTLAVPAPALLLLRPAELSIK